MNVVLKLKKKIVDKKLIDTYVSMLNALVYARELAGGSLHIDDEELLTCAASHFYKQLNVKEIVQAENEFAKQKRSSGTLLGDIDEVCKKHGV